MSRLKFLGQKCAKTLVFGFFLLGAFRLGFAQEGDHLYTITKAGGFAGTLHVYWDGSRSLEGVESDPGGVVVFQDQYEAGNYESASSVNGVESRMTLKADPRVTFLDQQTIHHVFLLKSAFPRKDGEVRHFKTVDPHSKLNFDAEIEYLGFQIMTLGKIPVKLRRFLLDLQGSEVNLYLDQDSNIVLIDFPSAKISYRLTDVAVSSFPTESWESPQESSCCTPREIEIQSTSGRILKGKLFVPAKNSLFPGALLFGSANQSPGLLEALGRQLSVNGVMPLVCFLDEKTPAGERIQDVDTLFRFLRRQAGVEPGYMFVVGYDSGVEDAAALMTKRKDLVASVFLSPSAGFVDSLGSKAWEVLSANLREEGSPLFVLQGEKDSLRELEGMREWFNRINRDSKLPRVVWSLAPAVGHDFLTRGDVALKFVNSEKMRLPDSSVFELIHSWLVERGLMKAASADVKGILR